MTVERSDHALVVYGGTMYAIGGMGRFQTHDSIEEFNTEVTINRVTNRIHAKKSKIFSMVKQKVKTIKSQINKKPEKIQND